MDNMKTPYIRKAIIVPQRYGRCIVNDKAVLEKLRKVSPYAGCA